jgi:hypothetical protein
MFYDPHQHGDFYAAGPETPDFKSRTTPAERRQMALGLLISLAPLVIVLCALAAMSILK